MSGLLDYIPRVDRCCGSCGLKPASITIGILSLLFSGCDYETYTMSSYSIFAQLLLVAYVALCIASILLLIGCCMDNSILVMIWVYVAIITVILGVILIIIRLVRFGVGSSAIGAIISLLFFILMVYFIMVVNSYRQDCR